MNLEYDSLVDKNQTFNTSLADIVIINSFLLILLLFINLNMNDIYN